jgi:glycerate kinase
MKIVIAPDSFKGSVSALQAAMAIETGVKRAVPNAETVLVPIADGGEGTMESLIAATGGRRVEVAATGPTGIPVQAAYGILGDQRTCVVETASASGLTLVPAEERNPLLGTSRGTGELIRRALDDGCRQFIVGLGGSATNDGGAGMLQALGMKLVDEQGRQLGPGGGELRRVHDLDDSEWDPRIAQSAFLIASDVQNPLIGPQGASAVFGPQKGATPDMVEQLDQALETWADLIEKKRGIRLHDMPGAGAAGGLGGAFAAFFPSRMQRGIDIVIRHTGLEKHLNDAALVITGEGRIDAQTASGKAPLGVAQAAQKRGVPVIVLAGSVGEGIDGLYRHGVTSVHAIANGPLSLEQAMEQAEALLAQTAEQVLRVYLAGARARE